MRGDSLRDLYAKALALLGLGVLAGVGALVDYWPVSGPLPAIAQAPLTPAMPESISPALVTQRTPVQRRIVESQLPARARTTTASQPPLPIVAEAAAGDLNLGESVDLAAVSVLADLPPAVAFLASDTDPALLAVSSDVPDVSVQQASIASASDPADLFGEAPAARIVLAEVTDETGEGLIAGAFKRTGTSIVKTGARTGASIFDAVRIVSGMVRRALPTN